MAFREIAVVVLIALVIVAGVKFTNLQVSIPIISQEQENGAAPAQQETQQNGSIPPQFLSPNASEERLAIDADNQSLVLTDYVDAECGDGICSVGEDCSSCGDCACGDNETCTDYGVCLEKEQCGDAVCTDLERASQTCCADCGCGENTLCNENVHACLPRVFLSPAKLNESIQAALALPEFADYVYTTSYDDYFEEQVVKAIVLRCPGEPQFHCEAYIYVNQNGEIISTEHTN